jgi:hypothetical protein
MRELKRHRSPRVLAAGHAFVQNLRRHYDIATHVPDDTTGLAGQPLRTPCGMHAAVLPGTLAAARTALARPREPPPLEGPPPTNRTVASLGRAAGAATQPATD